ncbi:hypothetical protein [Marinivivus vitaminiproducens]|uniref:hypothetical protein n=1 Tax=Marinivivus vitaminiproducens TaxID=3035935 RepID=UPI00279AAF19|nr:hypothetical protein P4R82_08515 [Geminicoccaceae bacterium SCSIO 64248]
MQCQGCRFWFSSKTQCRRNAPLPAVSEKGSQTLWPTTAADDWCGEFQPKVTDEKAAA